MKDEKNMKKKFMCTLLIISMICMPSIYAGEEEQVSGKIIIGNAFFTWKAQGSGGFRKFMTKELNPNLHRENLTISLPDGKTQLQIDSKGKLTITDINKKEERVVVRDSSGRIIIDDISSPDEERLGEEGLDEEEEEVLPAGSIVILSSLSNEDRIAVTYDKMVTLKSEVDDKFFLPVSFSKWLHSKQFKDATHHYDVGGKNEVFLEEKPAKIELLDSFLSLDEKGRREMAGKLTVSASVDLLAILHAHGLTKEVILRVW